MPADPVLAAHAALERAEEAIRNATADRDEARERLDEALAARGWRRLRSVNGDVYADRRTGHAQDLPSVIEIERAAA